MWILIFHCIAARKFDIHKAELMYRKVGHTLVLGNFPTQEHKSIAAFGIWGAHGPLPAVGIIYIHNKSFHSVL